MILLNCFTKSINLISERTYSHQNCYFSEKKNQTSSFFPKFPTSFPRASDIAKFQGLSKYRFQRWNHLKYLDIERTEK